jgi:hypothetical protein
MIRKNQAQRILRSAAFSVGLLVMSLPRAMAHTPADRAQAQHACAVIMGSINWRPRMTPVPASGPRPPAARERSRGLPLCRLQLDRHVCFRPSGNALE